jgi:hypothetical protein
MKTGVELIAEERKRQIEVEGWSAEHDDRHEDGELARAGACYVLEGSSYFVADELMGEDGWPFEQGWRKPKDRLSNLVRAGALIAAEIP